MQKQINGSLKPFDFVKIKHVGCNKLNKVFFNRHYRPRLRNPEIYYSRQKPEIHVFFLETFFDKLGTKLLMFTIYYPQTDGQSERINQTVEIAFR